MNRFVFDVESMGLHGEAFAVGYVVVDDLNNRVDEGLFCCHREHARGTFFNRDWVNVNVPPFDTNCSDPSGVRLAFWNKYQEWKEKGAEFWADCQWPVEARFLIACIEDNPTEREWHGPYPLHDIATVTYVLGLNPLERFPRLPDELPEHDPLCDARQSARLLIEMLFRMRPFMG